MDAIDAILERLEAELSLERELGVRTIACDRSLLTVAAPPAPARSVPRQPPAPMRSPARPLPKPAAMPAVSQDASGFDFVLLHDRPLSAGGVEMMTKALTAMGKTFETAPLVLAEPLPKAKVYVVLGGLALKKFFPGRPGEPGQWLNLEGGGLALVTHSPEYILRFARKEGAESKSTEKIKRALWRNLKVVRQRVKG